MPAALNLPSVGATAPVEGRVSLLDDLQPSGPSLACLPSWMQRLLRNRVTWAISFVVVTTIVIVVATTSGSDSATATQTYTYLDSYWAEIANVNMQALEGGTFTMGETGDTDFSPAHEVTLTEFLISKAEITNGQFCDFINICLESETIMVTQILFNGIENRTVGLGIDAALEGFVVIDLDGYITEENSCHIGYNGTAFYVEDDAYLNKPVTWISYNGALGFSRHYKCDLPTEAEWEYAARSGMVDYEYSTSTGELNTALANYNGSDAEGTIVASNSYQANQFELYDMTGNVKEYTLDFYNATFYEFTEDSTDPLCLEGATGDDHVDSYSVRGGSYSDGSDNTKIVWREHYTSEGGISPNTGFRIVMRPCEHKWARPCPSR